MAKRLLAVNCEWQQPQELNSSYCHCFNFDVFITVVLYFHSFVDLFLCAFHSFCFNYILPCDLILCALCKVLSLILHAIKRVYLFILLFLYANYFSFFSVLLWSLSVIPYAQSDSPTSDARHFIQHSSHWKLLLSTSKRAKFFIT